MHFTGAMAGALQILFPLWIRDLGGTEVTIGNYAGIGGAAAVLIRLPVGRLLDSLGRRPVLAVAGVVHALAWLAFVLVEQLGAPAIALVVIRGAAAGSLFAAFFTYATDVIPARRRAEGIAYFGIFGLLPDGLGPLLGEQLITAGGYPNYFLATAGFAAASLLISLLLPTIQGSGRAAPGGSSDVTVEPFSLRRIRTPLVTMMCFGIALGCVFTFVAPFAASEGRGSVSQFFLAYAVSAVIVRALAGRAPDRLGLRVVLIPSLFLYAFGVGAIPHAAAVPATIVIGGLCGIGHAFIFPVLNVLALDLADASQRGRTLTWMTAMLDAGATVAGPVLGFVAEHAGYRPMFALAGFGVCACAIALLATSRRSMEQRAQ